jgi:hypothetical protein
VTFSDNGGVSAALDSEAGRRDLSKLIVVVWPVVETLT